MAGSRSRTSPIRPSERLRGSELGQIPVTRADLSRSRSDSWNLAVERQRRH